MGSGVKHGNTEVIFSDLHSVDSNSDFENNHFTATTIIRLLPPDKHSHTTWPSCAVAPFLPQTTDTHYKKLKLSLNLTESCRRHRGWHIKSGAEGGVEGGVEGGAERAASRSASSSSRHRRHTHQHGAAACSMRQQQEAAARSTRHVATSSSTQQQHATTSTRK